MPTTFNVFFLGTAGDIDPTEGNSDVENASVLVGQTYGGIGSELFNNVRSFSPGTAGFAGGSSFRYDTDNTVSNDEFRIDGGADQVFDSIAVYDGTLTFTDGTTATIRTIVFQDTAGNLYLAPQTSQNSDQDVMESKPIRSLTIDSLIGDSAGLDADRAAGAYLVPDGVVDGTAGADTMALGFTDPDGDEITTGDDSILGGAGNDTIDGDAGNDEIDGGADNDSIIGGTGNDTIYGGTGRDTLDGGLGDDTVFGGDGFDRIFASAGADTLFGGDGSDIFSVNGGHGANTIFGGDEGGDFDSLVVEQTTAGSTILFTAPEGGTLTTPDAIVTFSDIEYFYLTDGADNFDASAANEDLLVFGFDGNDSLLGGSGTDEAYGGDGNDTITGNAGDDNIGGGAGNDTVFGGADQDFLFGNDGNDYIESGTGADTAFGGAGDDTVFGDSGDDTLQGGAGADTLYGGDGADQLFGGDDADLIFGGAGDTITGGEGGTDQDVLRVSEVESVTFGGGNNEAGTVFFTPASGGGSLTFSEIERISQLGVVDGTNGNDNMGVGYVDADGDTIDGADGEDDTIFGYAGNDNITAGGGSNTIYGGEGNDTLFSGSGTNLFFGGAGDSFAFGGSGVDDLRGGSGNDRFFGGGGRDTFEGNGGNDTVQGGAGDDVFFTNSNAASDRSSFVGGSGNDVFVGQNGSDDVAAGDDNDTITGGGGNDTLRGENGDDEIYGGDGNDTVLGGEGNDIIAAGAGTNSANGGNGTDVILFEGSHTDYSYAINGSGDLLVTNTATGDVTTLTQFERISFETEGEFDLVVGTNFNNGLGPPSGDPVFIVSGDGNDGAGGTANGDVYYGGAGEDGVGLGAGNDTIYGGAGNDGMDGGDGDDLIFGGAGDDGYTGGAGNDTLYGDAGNDTVAGDAGNDTIFGGDGNDTLFGDTGDDTLFGGDGADVLWGQAGNDTLTLGAGDDTARLSRFGGDDIITDFDIADTDADGFTNDQLDVSSLRDLEGNPINVNDVTVTDNGSGFARLSFPEGESIVLQGVPVASMSTPAQLYSAGIPCFTAGTPILTPRGPIPVEDLRAGDLVMTRDNGLQPIVWVGQRTLGRKDLLAMPKLRPIHVAPGTFGNEGPLLFSPQHGLLLQDKVAGTHEAFIRARHLARIKGGKVRVANGLASVTYVHLMFEAHQVIMSGGIWSESFYPGQQALASLRAAEFEELVMLFPALAASDEAARYGQQAREFAPFATLAPHLSALSAVAG